MYRSHGGLADAALVRLLRGLSWRCRIRSRFAWTRLRRAALIVVRRPQNSVPIHAKSSGQSAEQSRKAANDAGDERERGTAGV